MSEVNADALGATSARSPASNSMWQQGIVAAFFWILTAVVTVWLPDDVKWGSAPLFATIMAIGAAILLLLALATPVLPPAKREKLRYYGPWLIAIGVWFLVWEFATAKSGLLPKPFFSPPHGLLNVYVDDWSRLLICIAYSMRLWGLGFFLGTIAGFACGVALGWSKSFNYWGMPVLKLIGPVPATAWIPAAFYFFPNVFSASVFIVALSCGIPIAILTASGVASVNRAYYDVARTMGASNTYLVLKIAVPASLPHTFVGLFMGLYYSFAVLVVAEMLGAKYGLGWYIQFQTAYSGYANVYATIILMALLCSGIIKLLFIARNRLLAGQERSMI